MSHLLPISDEGASVLDDELWQLLVALDNPQSMDVDGTSATLAYKDLQPVWRNADILPVAPSQTTHHEEEFAPTVVANSSDDESVATTVLDRPSPQEPPLLEYDTQEIRHLLHIEDDMEVEQDLSPMMPAAPSSNHQSALQAALPPAEPSAVQLAYQPSVVWRTTTQSGRNLCNMAGLSHGTWGPAASFAAMLRGPQFDVMHCMVESLPRELVPRAINLLGDAKAAGVLLQHPAAWQQAARHALDLINTRLTLRRREFYIGITENPARRFSEHQENRWTSMDCYIFLNSIGSGNAEMAILNDVFVGRAKSCCKNGSCGGETRSQGEPHFCYIVWRG
jgi:hypothetical protein